VIEQMGKTNPNTPPITPPINATMMMSSRTNQSCASATRLPAVCSA
jgi:hypothetical protein